MKLREALKIVYDLAEQNMLTEEIAQESNELKKHYRKQQIALVKINRLIKEM